MNEKTIALILRILKDELYPELDQSDEELLENLEDFADLYNEIQIPQYVKNSAMVLILRHFDVIKSNILTNQTID